MGKPLMIREEDNLRLERLKGEMAAKTKVQVLREALGLLEKSLERERRVRRWRKVAALVRDESRRVHREFQRFSRMKDL